MNYMAPITLAPGDFERLSSDSTAGSVSFDCDKIAPQAGEFAGKKCQRVVLKGEGNNGRYRMDGFDPTQDTGLVLWTAGHSPRTNSSKNELLVIDGYRNIERFVYRGIHPPTDPTVINAIYYFPVLDRE